MIGDIKRMQCTWAKSLSPDTSFDAKIRSNAGRGKKLCSIEVASMVTLLKPCGEKPSVSILYFV